MTTAVLTVVDDGGEDRTELLARLGKQSNSLENRFLHFLHDHGYRLPDTAQEVVEGFYVRPDFAFHTAGGDVAIFIDGPVHDSAHQAGKDEAARAKLEDQAGWMVLRFRYDDEAGWHDIVAGNPTIFGPGKVTS